MGGEFNLGDENFTDFNKFGDEDVEDIMFLNLGEAGLAVAGFMGLIVLVLLAVFFRKNIMEILKK